MRLKDAVAFFDTTRTSIFHSRLRAFKIFFVKILLVRFFSLKAFLPIVFVFGVIIILGVQIFRISSSGLLLLRSFWMVVDFELMQSLFELLRFWLF